MSEAFSSIPAEISVELRQLTDDLRAAAGPNLSSLILYGGLARGRYRPGKSDVNVVVVLNDASAAALAAISPALRSANRSIAVEPMLVTTAEVFQLANSFPTKFLDIKNHHIVLAGEDPFTRLEVTREQIRLRAEQELRNMLLRLRRSYITAGSDTAMLGRMLTRLARPLAIELEALLTVAGKEVPGEDRTQTIFEVASSTFGFEREPLAKLAELRQNLPPSVDLNSLFRGVLDTIARAAEIAGQLKESTR